MTANGAIPSFGSSGFDPKQILLGPAWLMQRFQPLSRCAALVSTIGRLQFHSHQALPMRIPAASAIAPRRTIWEIACRADFQASYWAPDAVRAP
jgi:hypothetical protein